MNLLSPYNRFNPKKISPRYITIKLSKIKDKEFWKQQLGEKNLVLHGKKKKLVADFSEETL